MTILAEIGRNMSRFPTAGHLIAWAGLCPGKNESAGNRKGSRLRKGAPWLKTMLVQCAWAAKRQKDSYYRAQFYPLQARRGPQKAICAVAASILTAIYTTSSRMAFPTKTSASTTSTSVSPKERSSASSPQSPRSASKRGCTRSPKRPDAVQNGKWERNDIYGIAVCFLLAQRSHPGVSNCGLVWIASLSLACGVFGSMHSPPRAGRDYTCETIAKRARTRTEADSSGVVVVVREAQPTFTRNGCAVQVDFLERRQ
jgi:Transposase IS116/IS110/IS902 family